MSAGRYGIPHGDVIQAVLNGLVPNGVTAEDVIMAHARELERERDDALNIQFAYREEVNRLNALLCERAKEIDTLRRERDDYRARLEFACTEIEERAQETSRLHEELLQANTRYANLVDQF